MYAAVAGNHLQRQLLIRTESDRLIIMTTTKPINATHMYVYDFVYLGTAMDCVDVFAFSEIIATATVHNECVRVCEKCTAVFGLSVSPGI